MCLTRGGGTKRRSCLHQIFGCFEILCHLSITFVKLVLLRGVRPCWPALIVAGCCANITVSQIIICPDRSNMKAAKDIQNMIWEPIFLPEEEFYLRASLAPRIPKAPTVMQVVSCGRSAWLWLAWRWRGGRPH